ncbi:hypothetical protein [Saccharothrix syringae]|uniref:hypothetical protein n=1 Tax=Saccharothrix syringae TaxID=103733 RepID=UPI001292D1C2|nr:hypothetical protein [Saccharothrix syringae]
MSAERSQSWVYWPPKTVQYQGAAAEIAGSGACDVHLRGPAARADADVARPRGWR